MSSKAEMQTFFSLYLKKFCLKTAIGHYLQDTREYKYQLFPLRFKLSVQTDRVRKKKKE